MYQGDNHLIYMVISQTNFLYCHDVILAFGSKDETLKRYQVKINATKPYFPVILLFSLCKKYLIAIIQMNGTNPHVPVVLCYFGQGISKYTVYYKL